MVKMMITVVVIYAICWLPLHTITLIGDQHPEIYDLKYVNVIWLICHWLAMSNSCYNPVIYCWMNSKYRDGFRYLLRWCPCVRFETVQAQPDNGGKMVRMTTYMTSVKSSTQNKQKILFSKKCIDESSTSGSGEPEYQEMVHVKILSNGAKKTGKNVR